MSHYVWYSVVYDHGRLSFAVERAELSLCVCLFIQTHVYAEKAIAECAYGNGLMKINSSQWVISIENGFMRYVVGERQPLAFRERGIKASKSLSVFLMWITLSVARKASREVGCAHTKLLCSNAAYSNSRHVTQRKPGIFHIPHGSFVFPQSIYYKKCAWWAGSTQRGRFIRHVFVGSQRRNSSRNAI